MYGWHQIGSRDPCGQRLLPLVSPRRIAHAIVFLAQERGQPSGSVVHVQQISRYPEAG
jgi:hypothetical protein